MGCMCPCLRSSITVHQSPIKKDSVTKVARSMRSFAESQGSLKPKNFSRPINSNSARESVVMSSYQISSRKLEVVAKPDSPSSKKSQQVMLRDVMYPDVNCTVSVRILPKKSTNPVIEPQTSKKSSFAGATRSMRAIGTGKPESTESHLNVAKNGNYVTKSSPKAQTRSFRHLRIEQLENLSSPNINLNKPSQFSPLRKQSKGIETRPRTNTAPTFAKAFQARQPLALNVAEESDKPRNSSIQRRNSVRSVRLVKRPLSPAKSLRADPTDRNLEFQSRSPRNSSGYSGSQDNESPKAADLTPASKMTRLDSPEKYQRNSGVRRATTNSSRKSAKRLTEADNFVLPDRKRTGQSQPNHPQSTLLPSTAVPSKESPYSGVRSPVAFAGADGPRGECSSVARSSTVCRPETHKSDSLDHSLRKTQTCVYNRPEELSFCAISEKSGEHSDLLVPNFDPDLDEALAA